MNFDFDDTQYALRDLARDVFTKEPRPSGRGGLMDGKPAGSDVWRKLAEVGITGVTVPEAYGGAGGNEIDLALVFEEAGRAALPEPLLEVTGIAAPVVAKYGSETQKDRWLPAIASGEADIDVRIEGENVHVGDDMFAGATLDAYARAFAGTASMLNGVAMQLLDMTVAYVKERQQF